MISLKEAMEIAFKICDIDKKPKDSTVRTWIMEGLLTKREDYGLKGKGTVGLYHHTLPLQIATLIELKKDYKMKDISKATKEVLPRIKELEEGFNEEDLKEIRTEIIQKHIEYADSLVSYILEGNQVSGDIKNIELSRIYMEKFKNFYKKLEQKNTKV